MELYTSGLKSLKSGTIDPATGLPTNLVSVGSVYKDSVSFQGGDVTATPIFSQQEPNTPKKNFKSKGARSFVFQVMSTDVDTLAKFGVGKIVVLDGVKTLHFHDGNVDIEQAFEMTCDDDTVLTIHRGDVSSKENYAVSDTGIFLTEVTVTPLVPKVAGLASVTMRNPQA